VRRNVDTSKAMTAISIKEYYAMNGSRFTDADARKIGPVLQDLAKTGDMTADSVVKAARSSNSPLREYFEWNDKVAADNYRMEQARNMIRSIRVRFVSDGREQVARAFQVVGPKSAYPEEPRRYHAVSTIHEDSKLAAQMMEHAVGDLQSWRRKYEPYVELWSRFGDVFQGVLNQIDEFSEEFPSVRADQDMADALSVLLDWRAHYGENVSKWAAYAENIKFMLEAIGVAEEAFTKQMAVKAKRKCLRCTKEFESSHSGNRLCLPCSAVVSRSNGGLEEASFEGGVA
jgi:hypothetical protein